MLEAIPWLLLPVADWSHLSLLQVMSSLVTSCYYKQNISFVVDWLIGESGVDLWIKRSVERLGFLIKESTSIYFYLYSIYVLFSIHIIVCIVFYTHSLIDRSSVLLLRDSVLPEGDGLCCLFCWWNGVLGLWNRWFLKCPLLGRLNLMPPVPGGSGIGDERGQPYCFVSIEQNADKTQAPNTNCKL